MKYEIRPNKKEHDYKIHKVEIIEAKTKQLVIKATLLTCFIFLTGTSAYGITKGNFEELSKVWTIMSPIIGTVFGYYLGTKNG
jgi:hypothetical protein